MSTALTPEEAGAIFGRTSGNQFRVDALVETWCIQAWKHHADKQEADFATTAQRIESLTGGAGQIHINIPHKNNSPYEQARIEPTPPKSASHACIKWKMGKAFLSGSQLIMPNLDVPEAIFVSLSARAQGEGKTLYLSDILDVGFPLPALEIKNVSRGTANTIFRIEILHYPWDKMRPRIEKSIKGDGNQ